MKKIIILIVLLILIGCTKINQASTKINKEKTFLGYISDSNNNMVLLLNTEVYLTTTNDDLKETMVNKATQLLTKYHILLDSHHYYKDENGNTITNIKVLNDSINNGPQVVDKIIIDVLKEAITLSTLTNGYFNFTLGELSNLYHDKLLPYDTYNKDPDSKEIENYTEGIIPFNKMEEYIIIDDEKNTIELKQDSRPYSLDLGAFSKGYILNKVYLELKNYNSSFLLNAGSSSIVTYKADNEDTSWTIGIKNPEQDDDQLLAFSLDNGSISTSGDYESYYYLENGTKRHHILNPYTGYSENFYRSNTLISNNAGVIDALSTAIFNIKDQQELLSIIHKVEEYYNDDISFMYIEDGLNIFMDNSFNSYIIGNIPLNNNITVTTTIIKE